jgi:predicted amidohydrolase YtcJ
MKMDAFPRVIPTSLMAAMISLAAAWTSVPAAEVADTILVHGKILTVDREFSQVEALAIKGARILAVGADKSIRALADAHTRVIDLHGRTVIPGLIDNHMHFIRAIQRWNLQARIDEVSSRTEALKIIRRKAASLPPGAWLMVQGGWHENQFADHPGGFTLAELDEAAPRNPLFLQVAYFTVYANTLALKAVGVDPSNGARSEQADAHGLAGAT